jgi:8-oxo-dGTP pyrophosphatase MutT (NUDIX family)
MEQEQRTNNQVEGIIFKRDDEGRNHFLLMRRIPSRGGFWQPLTGGVRVGEELEAALRREVEEETGIVSVKRVINTGFAFPFSDHGKDYVEHVFGVEVLPNATVILSPEHDSQVWVSKEEVLALLRWPGNIEGFRRLCSILESE